MIATLILEAIGDNGPPRGRKWAVRIVGRTWVARLAGRTANGFDREFLQGARDYRHSNSVGSRGVTLTFVLHEGNVYEANHRVSWNKERRFFCRAEAGRVVEIERSEVIARLDSASCLTRIQTIVESMRNAK